MPSFTSRIQNLQQIGPVVEITLTPSVAYIQTLGLTGQQIPALRLHALIDTGATSSVVSAGFVQQLGISPVGTTFINTPSSTNVRCLQYDVRMLLVNNVGIPSLIITEAPLQGQHIQCLIGRDVLAHGVLIYTGYDNSFTLSF